MKIKVIFINEILIRTRASGFIIGEAKLGVNKGCTEKFTVTSFVNEPVKHLL